jgi:hypothetical protein
MKNLYQMKKPDTFDNVKKKKKKKVIINTI